MARRHHNAHQQELRSRLAQEAARILAEEGIRDYLMAKRKAAARLGIADNSRLFPNNQEVEAALIEHQRLFQGDSQPARLRELREAARSAMQLFADFSPRLVGSVLNGTATLHSHVQLHLFTDTAEQVPLHLMARNIPHETIERRFKRRTGVHQAYPGVGFVAGDVRIEAVIFPFDAIREAPASPVDGRPMRRAGLAELDGLLCDPA